MAPKEEKDHLNRTPDDIIHELGGCGRFQIRMALIVHIMKTVICWSAMSMIFVTATPKWWCADDITGGNMTDNITTSTLKMCTTRNGSKCTKFEFAQDMRTIVNEWELICDRAWIPATMLTIQIVFQLFGNFFAGQIADTIGRKIPFFSSIVVICLASIMCYFSVSWVMFTVSRVFIGIGAGLFLTTQYSYLSEFSLARWRTWLIGFPSWPMQTCLMALVLWLLKDWRKIHLVIALMCVPFLAAWWFIPESFRWYYGHDRVDDAERVVTEVSKVNRRPEPDMMFMKELATVGAGEMGSGRKYTALDLFKSKFLIKITVLLSLNWVGLGLVSYGISYGIQKLSGSIYLNLFLFNLVHIPSKGIAIWIQNRFGRRLASIMCFLTTGLGALIVGIVQYIDTDKRDSLTNGFALVANLGMATAWGPIQTMTIETYPTVVRNIGFGLCSVLARVGAALGPQLVYMDMYVPGLLYFFCGGVAMLCVFGLLFIPETKDRNLNDKLNENRNKVIIKRSMELINGSS